MLAVFDATVCFTRQDGDVYLYGIFDGHSGSKVAAFAAQRLPEEILLGQLHGRVTDDEIKDVLKQVFTMRLHVIQCTVLLSQFCLSVLPSVRCVYCDKME